MNNLSKRLKLLTSFINKTDKVADVGCDHGYLAIYLKQNNLCENIICSDINKNALSSSINNIKKANLDIKTYLSDGLKNLDLTNINTLVIAGMGANTIINILDVNKLKNINKIIIQSNNDWNLIRRYLNNIGYYLEEEINIKDKNKWYTCMKYIKSNKKIDEEIIEYGYLNNKEYIEYLIKHYKDILTKIPSYNEEYNKYKNMIDYLSKK